MDQDPFPMSRVSIGLLGLAAAACLGGCATVPINPKTVAGEYRLPRGDTYYTGESVDLQADGAFVHESWTDVADPYPIVETRGRYELSGNKVSFRPESRRFADYGRSAEKLKARQRPPAEPLPPQFLAMNRGRFVLLSASEYQTYRTSRRISDSALFQKKL